MTKPFSHTGAGFALPHLHVDPQGWNLEGPNAAIQAFHSFRAGVGRLRNDREISRLRSQWPPRPEVRGGVPVP